MEEVWMFHRIDHCQTQLEIHYKTASKLIIIKCTCLLQIMPSMRTFKLLLSKTEIMDRDVLLVLISNSMAAADPQTSAHLRDQQPRICILKNGPTVLLTPIVEKLLNTLLTNKGVRWEAWEVLRVVWEETLFLEAALVWTIMLIHLKNSKIRLLSLKTWIFWIQWFRTNVQDRNTIEVPEVKKNSAID